MRRCHGQAAKHRRGNVPCGVDRSVQPANGQSGKPFYQGKTIQLLVASGPGATTDISARLVGRYLGKHLRGESGHRRAEHARSRRHGRGQLRL